MDPEILAKVCWLAKCRKKNVMLRTRFGKLKKKTCLHMKLPSLVFTATSIQQG